MLWPLTTTRADDGQLMIDGVKLADLAAEHGTPLYVFDVATIRAACRAQRETLEAAHPRGRIAYAGKAWISKGVLQIVQEEGLSLDVVSGGELAAALAWGFPAERIHFHGNNKGPEELQLALEAGIESIVIDNFDEIAMLGEMTGDRATPQRVLLRLNPGIDVHTHDYRKTGIPDSKFGLGIENGHAAQAVEQLLQHPGLLLHGYHAHIGSQIFEVEPFVQTMRTVFEFAVEMRERFGVIPEEISPGGGLGIRYAPDDPTPAGDDYTTLLGQMAIECAAEFDLPDPIITLEPGRSIIGPAGVSIYTLGARKDIPGVRTYVSIDGGMADNIRPALYGAVYTGELVARPSNGDLSTYTIAGKFCESGDVLIESLALPSFERGELLAVPASGAYALPMASNYNWSLRPAVVFVEHGQARLVQRRETVADLLARDV